MFFCRFPLFEENVVQTRAFDWLRILTIAWFAGFVVVIIIVAVAVARYAAKLAVIACVVFVKVWVFEVLSNPQPLLQICNLRGAQNRIRTTVVKKRVVSQQKP